MEIQIRPYRDDDSQLTPVIRGCLAADLPPFVDTCGRSEAPKTDPVYLSRRVCSGGPVSMVWDSQRLSLCKVRGNQLVLRATKSQTVCVIMPGGEVMMYQSRPNGHYYIPLAVLEQAVALRF